MLILASLGWLAPLHSPPPHAIAFEAERVRGGGHLGGRGGGGGWGRSGGLAIS